jgi:hypothetical protein
MFHIQWSTEPEKLASDKNEVESLIDQIENRVNDIPVAVQIWTGEKSSLTCFVITVGADKSFTQFYDIQSQPQVSTALNLDGDDQLIAFDFMGEISEKESTYWIHIDLAKQALGFYLDMNKRFDTIQWNN